MNAVQPGPLKYLYPGWFSIVMGLAGLSLAWQRARPLMGEPAGVVATLLGALAGAVFVVLAAAAFWRLWQHPEAWREDLRHPGRYPFIAAIPIALLLVATVGVSLAGPQLIARTAWWLGCLGQLGVTVWALGRWWRGAAQGGLVWPSVTPALFIPIVGNVLPPLAGVPLGYVEWSAAQFGVGLMFWLPMLALVIVRLAVHGPWPERLRPTAFIVIAPPAVIGLGALQFGAAPLWGWIFWGMAAFGLLWAGTQARAIAAQPFGLPHWALSFPLAALAALSLSLAAGSDLLKVLAPALLALASLVVGALLLATVRGLRNGTLLAPEPVAAIVPAQG